MDKETIERIKSAVNIVDVIGEYVTLKKEGKDYKGLCPFHSDNSPSLTVNAVKGIYKCFACGQGGDVIDFLMRYQKISFEEAMKILADKAGVPLPHQEKSPDDEIDDKKRDTMFIINTQATKFFHENLLSDDEESRKALAYATSRWPLDFIKANSIGYASNDWNKFHDWSRKNNLNEDLLLELGLLKRNEEKKNVYDSYRGRIMIPIRDRYQRIIGFTARLLPELDTKSIKIPKYINSPLSLIYNKSNSFFGMDYALNSARKTGVMNLVEGAPDVMRLQILGVSNTVATLGTSWTEQQLKKIKKVTDTINIIPDSDIPKGLSFAPGFHSAMRTGCLALSLGFSVTVQEIPSDGDKADPDSFITSKIILDALPKNDFVLWYADKLLTSANGEVFGRACAIHDIVGAVRGIKDHILQESYTDKLIELYGHEDMWKRAILDLSPPVPVTSNSISMTEYIEMFKGSEIKVGNNCYISYTKDGEVEISNFIMIPLYLIRDGATSSRVFILRNVHGVEVRIEFSIEEMTVLQKFRSRIERESNYMWYGTSAKFNKLRGILYSHMEPIIRISTLGWQKQGFYAFGNGVVHKGIWHPVDDEGIIRLPDSSISTIYLPAFSKINEENIDRFLFELKFIHLPESSVRLSSFASQLRFVYGNNAIVGICFIIVCLFRDIIISHRREFPSLFLFGPKGTGKTAFGELLQSPFVYCGDHPNIRTSTMASLSTVLAQAEDAIMHLDEYKNDIDVEKIELLKGLWDCQGRSKLDVETRKREQSKVLSGVIISGQEKPTVDIALYSRQCILPFNKDTHTEEEKSGFRTLKDWEHEGTSYIVLELLQIRNRFERLYRGCYEEAVKAICSSLSYSLDERILHNWSVILASFMAVDKCINLPFTYEEVLQTVVNSVEYQNEECRHSNELSIFWKTIDYLKQDNHIFGLCDYRIHELTKIKVDVKMDGKHQTVTRDFGVAKKILMVPTNSRVFAQYALHLQRTHEKVIPENTLKYYIENSPEYIGKMNSVRFASVENVKEWPRVYSLNPNNKDLQPRLSEKPVQAYCLDFDAVEAAYGTNLYSDYMGFDLIHSS